MKTLPKAKLRRLYTFVEARKIKGPFVYGLCDDHGVFYVGKTIDADRRFYSYSRPAKLSPRLQRRLRDAMGPVMVSILEHNPVNLDHAERRWIGQLAPQLVNVRGSMRHTTANMPLKQKARALRSQLARCATCGTTEVTGEYHRCMNEKVEILNPLANAAMQDILLCAGFNRDKFSLAPSISRT